MLIVWNEGFTQDAPQAFNLTDSAGNDISTLLYPSALLRLNYYFSLEFLIMFHKLDYQKYENHHLEVTLEVKRSEASRFTRGRIELTTCTPRTSRCPRSLSEQFSPLPPEYFAQHGDFFQVRHSLIGEDVTEIWLDEEGEIIYPDELKMRLIAPSSASA